MKPGDLLKVIDKDGFTIENYIDNQFYSIPLDDIVMFIKNEHDTFTGTDYYEFLYKGNIVYRTTGFGQRYIHAQFQVIK